MFDPSAFAFGSMMPASAPAAAMTVCMAAVASGPWRNKVTTDGFCLATNDIKWLRDFQGCCWPGTKSLKPSQTTYHTEIAIKTCNYCTGRYIARTHTHTHAVNSYLSRKFTRLFMHASRYNCWGILRVQIGQIGCFLSVFPMFFIKNQGTFRFLLIHGAWQVALRLESVSRSVAAQLW